MNLEMARARLHALKRVIVDKNTKPQGESEVTSKLDEIAVAASPDAVQSFLNRESMDEIRQIDAALARIEAGTYGLCPGCGEQIGEARLKARPQAPKCITCTEENSVGAKIRRPPSGYFSAPHHLRSF